MGFSVIWVITIWLVAVADPNKAATLDRQGRSATDCNSVRSGLSSYANEVQSLNDGLSDVQRLLQHTVAVMDRVPPMADRMCSLSSTVTTVKNVGQVVGKLPVVGGVVSVITTAVTPFQMGASRSCDTMRRSADRVRTLRPSVENLRRQVKRVNNFLKLTRYSATTGEVAIAGALTCGDRAATEVQCRRIMDQVRHISAVVNGWRHAINSLVPSLNPWNEIRRIVDHIHDAMSRVLDPLQSILNILNSLTQYLSWIPRPCIPAFNMPYPCGLDWPCCGRIFGRCICRYPRVRICWTRVPEICPPGLDMIIRALGISFPSIPGLDFLNQVIPDLPEIPGLPEWQFEFFMNFGFSPDFSFPHISTTLPTYLNVLDYLRHTFRMDVDFILSLPDYSFLINTIRFPRLNFCNA